MRCVVVRQKRAAGCDRQASLLGPFRADAACEGGVSVFLQGVSNLLPSPEWAGQAGKSGGAGRKGKGMLPLASAGPVGGDEEQRRGLL